jgi:hypothetical protein
MAGITVSALRAGEAGAFYSWLAGTRHSMIYGAPSFAAFIEAALGVPVTTLVARRGSEFAGAVSFARCNVPGFGAILNALPWYGSHGGFWLDGRESAASRTALLEAFEAECSSPDVQLSTLVLSPFEQPELETYAKVLASRVVDHRVGQMTNLPQAGADIEERLMGVLRQKTRNLVRKSLKQDFQERVSDDEADWRWLHDMHTRNIAALGGIAKSWPHFEAMRRTFAVGERRLSLCWLDGQPVAGLLLLRFGRTVEYLTPVVHPQFRTLQPLSFLIWQAMLGAVDSGCSLWNWGGTWSAQSTLHHFKAGWGAKDLPYSYLIKASSAGLERVRADLPSLRAAAPFFFLYPYDKLNVANTA